MAIRELRAMLGRQLGLLACVLALQSSGLVHAVVDTLGGESDDCATECPEDRGHCPPFCPDCACAHGVSPSLPTVTATIAAAPAPRLANPFGAVAEPALDSPHARPFHPPRA